MKKRNVIALCLSIWSLCIVLSSCERVEMKIPEDTSAIEEYIESMVGEDTYIK